MPGLTAPEMVDAAHEGRLDVLVTSGGNFTEVLPAPAYVRQALARVPLRVHLDIVLSAQMLVEPADTVVLLPAQTRYEMRGGVTETSTERRVIFSPEILGPRDRRGAPRVGGVHRDGPTGPARGGATWSSFRARPRSGRRSPASSPLTLSCAASQAEGDQFQYGGPMLCAGWRFPTADGKARFSAVALPERHVPDGAYVVTTRRGRQFNSMVQGDRDGHTGADRDAVLINGDDAIALGAGEGRPGPAQRQRRDGGAGPDRARGPGTLQVHWPEGEVLLDGARRDGPSGIPDYTAVVRVEVRPRPARPRPARGISRGPGPARAHGAGIGPGRSGRVRLIGARIPWPPRSPSKSVC